MKILGTQVPIWLVAMYPVALAAILAWPIIAFSSVFLFDAPGSTQNPAVNAAFGLLVCYPILPVAGIPASFLAYRKQHKTTAIVLAGVALLPVVALLVLISVFVYDGTMAGLSGGLVTSTPIPSTPLTPP